MRIPNPALAIAATAAICPPALADVMVNWTDPNHFDWEISHVPDLDQRRIGLPGNGSWHCAPAAALNLFAYFANHGLWQLEPGPGNYQSQSL